jgi:CubicO group peptidase (beta-lactamase class C family)
MNPRLFSFVFLIAFSGSLQAQADRFAPVTERFNQFVTDGDTAGAVLLVGSPTGVKYLRSFGLRNSTDATSKMTDDTLFRIASMTKPITAIGIMMMQDEGKLSVDDLVENHLPEFKGQRMLMSEDKEKKTITLGMPTRPIRIRDLLTHTSGLAQYPIGFADLYTKRNRTLAETTAAVSQLPLQFEPGSKWSYSNSGIDTLGRLLEVVSQMSYETFLQTRLFDPLQMNDTCFYPTEEQMKRVATLHDKRDGKSVPASSTGFRMDFASTQRKHPIPAGGLFSTAADQAKLYQLMLLKGEVNGKRILSEKAVSEMTQPQTGDIKTGFVDGMSFGYGWAVVREPKGVTEQLNVGTFGHGGAFGTQGWIDPKQKIFFVLMIQRSGLANSDASELRKEFQRLAIEALK